MCLKIWNCCWGNQPFLGNPRNLKIVSTLEDQPPVASTRLQLRFGPCEFLGRIASMGEKKFDHLSSETNTWLFSVYRGFLLPSYLGIYNNANIGIPHIHGIQNTPLKFNMVHLKISPEMNRRRTELGFTIIFRWTMLNFWGVSCFNTLLGISRAHP